MPLLNAFIESIVTVGFHADRGLTPEPESKEKRTIFGSYFQPSLLAFVTGDRAIYPQAANNQFVDPSYPPSNQSYPSSMTGSTISSDSSVPSSPAISILRSTHRQFIIPGALNNLPMFCFPDSVRVTYQREPVKIHHIVLTQEEGKRSYALVLTLQQIFELKSEKPDDDGIFQIEDIKTYGLNTRRPSISRIPIATDRAKLVQAALSATKENGTQRSRKMPTAYGRYNDSTAAAASAPKTRSVTPSDSNRKSYTEPTISSTMKSVSTTAAPPTRMSRSNSHSESNQRSRAPSLSGSGSSTSAMRRREVSSSATRTSTSSSTTNKPVAAAPAVFDATRPFYLPHCIILISSQPYWTAMQETISIIYDDIVGRKIEISSNEYKQMIKNFAYLVCNSPVPPIPWERFSLSFNIRYDQSILQFDPPIGTDRTVLDLDLSILLLNLNIGKLLDVLSAIFTEQPIMFFSSNYSTLVTTLECLLYLIYPLKWMNIYVPLVPRGLEAYYLEGPPGTYIMGAHSRHQVKVEEVDSCCTCNIDDQKNIHIPLNMNLHRVPSSKLKRFTGPITRLLDEIKTERSLQNTRSPIHLRIEKQREEERQRRQDTNNKIIDIFSDLMVDLCGDIFLPIYWKMNKQQASPNNTLKGSNASENQGSKVPKSIFDRDTYLCSRMEGDEKDFYEVFIRTMSFQLLLEDVNKESMNSTPFRQICQLRSKSAPNPILGARPGSIAIDDEDEEEEEEDELNPLAEAMNGQFVLWLPDWTLATNTHYLESCIEVFSNELNNAQDEHSTPAITVYAFLRGCALLARGFLLEGLEDLYRIENVNLFPLDYIKTSIVPLLRDASLLETFLQEIFYVRAPEWKKLQQTPTFKGLSVIDLEESGSVLDMKVPVAIAEDTVNENELLYPQFSDHVRRSYIAMDEETLETLFISLLYWVDPGLADAVKKNKSLLTTAGNGEAQNLASPVSRAGNSKLKFSDLIHSPRGNGNTNKNRQFLFPQGRPALPAGLYESFLDIWRQTNAEKVRMIRCLPEERRSQESILKISSPGVISKKDGPGQLILTQKRLYFLRETCSSAHLLTELKNIKTIEKNNQSKAQLRITVSSLSTSLPRDNNTPTKGKTSSLERDGKLVIILFFKTEQEQDIWNTIINEIFCGLVIANKQCDTSMLNKASRHIALMDALTHINYYRSSGLESPANHNDARRKSRHHNEESLIAALNDFKILTEMFKSGVYDRLPRTTREVLTRRLSPSINESEIHSVRCVAFAMHSDQAHSSLWCAYGSKLKVYNVATWICDWKDLIFPSLINCMCLDNRSQLWIGCVDGQVFVVDTETYTVGDRLVLMEGTGGCQTIAYDADQDVMLIANQTGLVIPWDTTTWDQYDEFVLFDTYKRTVGTTTPRTETPVVYRPNFNPFRRRSIDTNQTQSKPIESDDSHSVPLPEQVSTSGTAKVVPAEKDKLDRIQIYDERLFACYQNDYVLVFRLSESGSYVYETLISVKYKVGESIPIDSFVVYKDQLWIATGNILHFFNVSMTASNNFYNPIMKRPIEDDRLISMIGFSDYIWAGSLRGNIYVFLMHNYELYRTFSGHTDSVCCLSSMLDRYVISGASAKDRSIAIWNDVQPKNDVEANSNSVGRTRTKTITQTNLPRKMTLTDD